MRKYFKLSGLICIALLMTGTTYAQTIPGIYIGVNDENTELQVPNPCIVNGEPIGTRFRLQHLEALNFWMVVDSRLFGKYA